jgi:hypothetical protein
MDSVLRVRLTKFMFNLRMFNCLKLQKFACDNALQL